MPRSGRTSFIENAPVNITIIECEIIIPLYKAAIILQEYKLSQLKDRTFGDSEMEWTDSEGKEVAFGYLGRDASIKIIGYSPFEGDEAIFLMNCYKTRQISYNEQLFQADFNQK